MFRRRPLFAALGAILLVAGFTAIPVRSQSAVTPDLTVRAHRGVTTAVPAAQQAFDRGLLELYAFNIGAARDDFALAARRDPQCAMAYWGSAVSEVTDINIATSADDETRGRRFLMSAQAAREAAPAERELIAALARRFSPALPAARRAAAYAAAMQRYASLHPDDADGLVLAAIAQWRFDMPDAGHPQRSTSGRDLDLALAADPQNPGVRHMRVHYYEQIGLPRQALSDADWLYTRTYAPGLSHLPHMAGHIYLHTGDFDKAAVANLVALENDRRYFAQGNGAGQKYMQFYHMHVLTNLLYALTVTGRDALARDVVRRESGMMGARVAVRERSTPARARIDDAFDRLAIAVWAARSGDAARAGRMRERIEHEDSPADAVRARLLIDAASAQSHGDRQRAVGDYQKLYAAYEYDLGDPPFGWDVPIPEGYATALLRAGRYREASRIFDEALLHRPFEPRLLYGKMLVQQHLGQNSRPTRIEYLRRWHGRRGITLQDLG